MSESGVKKKSALSFLGATKAERAASIAAIVLSVILIPILIFNCILIIKTVIKIFI